MRRNLLTKVAVATTILSLHGGSSAGFMDDLYTSAGAAANTTPAGVYATQSGRYVTGGSAAWRVPQRDFNLFSFSPPRFTAGCGGIDLYGGSFGFVNADAFINYLKNIGQNASGLLFKMALQLVSPSLNATIEAISNDIQKMNGMLGNSCQMAKLLTSGAQNYVDKLTASRAAEGQGGAYSGIFSSYEAMKTDLSNITGMSLPATEQTNSGGAPIGRVEQNVTWVAMNSGQFSDYSQSFIDYTLSLMGTTIYRNVAGSDGKATIEPKPWTPALEVRDLAGHWHESATVKKMYSCPMDSSNPCVNSPDWHMTFPTHKPFARMAYESLRRLSDGVLNRTAIGGTPNYAQDIAIVGATSLPAYRMIELTTSPGMLSINEAMVQKYADFMGLEMAANVVDTMAAEFRKALAGGGSVLAAGKLQAADVEALEQRVKELQEQGRALRAELRAVYSDQASLLAELEHMERSLQTNFSLRLASNIRYSASR